MESKYPDVRRCRLCGCEEKFVNFKEIFEDNSELNLQCKIDKLLPVVIMPRDPLPHTICSDCIDKLNLFNEFYDTTLKTDQFLRNFFPSAPESEIENVDPIIQITNWPKKFKNLMKLPAKSFPKDTNADSSDDLPTSKTELTCVKVLEGFIINPITKTESIYTCRNCFRTFTKYSSALTHKCVKIEDCGELEMIGKVEDSLKISLPPLKIRLNSTQSEGLVCNICQKPFAKRSAVEKHLKTHSLNFNRSKKRKRKSKLKRKLQNQTETVSGDVNVENVDDDEISICFIKDSNKTVPLDVKLNTKWRKDKNKISTKDQKFPIHST